jgi:hypothetical protein
MHPYIAPDAGLTRVTPLGLLAPAGHRALDPLAHHQEP